MERLVHKKREAHQMLNIIWGIFTALILLLGLYFIWQYQQREINYQIEETAGSISAKLDNLIDDLTQAVLSTHLIGNDLTQCKQTILPEFQHLVLNVLEIAGLAIIDEKNHVLCSTLPQGDRYTNTPANARHRALFGPIHLSDIDQPAFIIQQPFGSYNIDIYLLKNDLVKLLETESPVAQLIALYDQKNHKILMEITRGTPDQKTWHMSDPNEIKMDTVTIDDTKKGLFRHELTQLHHVDIVVQADETLIMRMTIHYVMMAGTIILLMSFCIYYYLWRFIREHYSLRRAMMSAIKNDDFFPVYQPIMNRHLNRCCGAEILVRWQSPDEVIMPESFIEYAEQSGLIVPITLQFTHKVLTDCANLLHENPDYHIGINLSSAHFTDLHFLKSLTELCHKHHIPPHQIMLEVTERDLLQNDASLVSKMVELRQAGFLIAVDDFGTGNASISYLQRFPFNYLKIDRMFVSAIGTGAVTESLNHSIIEMANRLGLIIIAEGVETYEQVETLENNGAFLMQGWYFSKALPFEKFMKFIKRNS